VRPGNIAARFNSKWIPDALRSIGQTFRPSTDSIEFFDRQDRHDSITSPAWATSIDFSDAQATNTGME
jgi:hypothetical protein